jgi:hypothetical protein
MNFCLAEISTFFLVYATIKFCHLIFWSNSVTFSTRNNQAAIFLKAHFQVVKIGVQSLYGLQGAAHKGAELLLNKFAHL